MNNYKPIDKLNMGNQQKHDSVIKQRADHDEISSPKHYAKNPCVVCTCGKEYEIRHVTKLLPGWEANIVKYIWRYKDKEGVKDLKKAQQYLTWLIEDYENKK